MSDWSNYYALRKLREEIYDKIDSLEDDQYKWEECLKIGYWDPYDKTKALTNEDRQKLLGYIDRILQDIGRKEEEVDTLNNEFYKLEKEVKKT